MRTAEQNALVASSELRVWMRTSILPRVRKVYRVIPGGLAAGSYTVQIRNNYDPVIFEDGSKVRRAPGDRAPAGR